MSSAAEPQSLETETTPLDFGLTSSRSPSLKDWDNPPLPGLWSNPEHLRVPTTKDLFVSLKHHTLDLFS